MGRTKGSKNGVRKIPLKNLKNLSTKELFDDDSMNEIVEEANEANLPIFDTNVLKAYKSKNYEKCINLIERILVINTDENKDHYKILQAAAYTMHQKYDTSQVILDEVLSADPKNIHAIYGKGVAFYFSKDYKMAVRMFEMAIDASEGKSFERARDMIMRLDLERRSAVIMVKKMTKSENTDNFTLDSQVTVEAIEELDSNEIEVDVPENDVEMELRKTDEKRILHVHNQNIDEISVTAEKDEKDFDEKTMKHKENEKVDYFSSKSTLSVASTKSFEDPLTIKANLKRPAEPIPDIPESLPKSFKPSTGKEFFAKGMELYMAGSLKKSLKMFEKAIKVDPKLTKADEMGTKAQELLELMDVAAMNMIKKNYSAVVEILNEALEVDETNSYVNRPFYFQRGLALYHLGRNQESIKDYAEFDRINKQLNEN